MPTTVTSTIKPSGGDYTTITAWEAAKQGDLVSADQVQVAECYTFSGGLNDLATISGSTTDATRYMKITAASANRHNGIPQAGFYIANNDHFSTGLNLSDSFVQVDGIEVRLGGASTLCFSGAAGASQTVKNCIAFGGGSGANGFSNFDLSICCLAYSCGLGWTGTDFVSYQANNCLAASSSSGFRVPPGGSPILKNCVAYSNTTNYNGTFSGSSTHNGTSSASDDAPGGNSQTSIASGDFNNAASNDFHVASGGSTKLQGTGTDLSGTFTTDIDGETWTTWGIGIDFKAAAAAGSLALGRAGARQQHLLVR